MKRIVLFVLSLFLLSFFVPVLPPVCQAAVFDGAWQYRLRPDTGEWTNYIENTPVPVQGDEHEVWLRILIKPGTPQADTLLFTTKGQTVRASISNGKSRCVCLLVEAKPGPVSTVRALLGACRSSPLKVLGADRSGVQGPGIPAEPPDPPTLQRLTFLKKEEWWEA